MSKSDFVPKSDVEFLAWLDHLALNAEAHQAELGISDATLAKLKAAAVDFHAKLNAHTQAQAAANHASEEKKASRKDNEAAARSFARQVKVGDGYTDAFGKLLRIIGAEDSTDYSSLKPDLTAKDLGGGKLALDFTKNGTDGVNLYAFDETTHQYVFLARATQAPYTDSRPLADPAKPEIRRYKAIYVLIDEETGQFSDEVVATCSP